MISKLIIYIIVGYLFGSIPTGYLYCKRRGIDIFSEGSKNPGSTNVGRILGHKAGVTVFMLDLVKTWFSIFICILFSNAITGKNADNNLIIFYTGLGAVIGHNFPFTTKFRGGKGITCTVAVVAYFNVIYAIILYLIHKAIGKLTHYVSLASIITLLIYFLSALILSIYKIYPFNFDNALYVIPAIGIMATFGILRHASNIKRLLNGTENRI